MDRGRVIFFCVILLIVCGGIYYIGESIKRAEVYYCYYDIPPKNTLEEKLAPIIKPVCQNDTRNMTIGYCEYKGTILT